MGNVSKIRIGACDVSWGGVSLGYTKGGVSLAVATTKHDTKVDQEGETAIDSWLISRTLSIKVPMVETGVAQLATVLKGSGGTLSGNLLTVTHGAGLSQLSAAQSLVLHPTGVDPSDTSQDIVVPKAATSGDVSFSYQVDSERVFEITFVAFARAHQALFYYGGAPTGASLPDDVTSNGGVMIAGNTALPEGLSSNGGVIMTDGSVEYPNTASNGGVLVSA